MLLLRYKSSPQGTLGLLLVGSKLLHTIELPWRENKRSISCIPTGSYTVEPFTSSHFGQVYLVNGVEGRSGILFHSGNRAGSVELGYKTDSRGCILVGKRVGKLENQDAVLLSRAAMRSLRREVGQKSMKLEVRDI